MSDTADISMKAGLELGQTLCQQVRMEGQHAEHGFQFFYGVLAQLINYMAQVFGVEATMSGLEAINSDILLKKVRDESH